MWCKIFNIQDGDALLPETQVLVNMFINEDGEIKVDITGLLDLRNFSIEDFYWVSEEMEVPSYELGMDIIENFTEKSAIAFLNRQIASNFSNLKNEMKMTTEDVLKNLMIK